MKFVDSAKQEIREFALNIGFDTVGFVSARAIVAEKIALNQYIECTVL